MSRTSRPALHRRIVFAGLSVVCAVAALATSPARAQSIDYGAYERLLGEPITTSATGLPQKATEAPVDLEIITADDIRRSGARDIPGVLRHVAGVDVLQFANDDADVSIRGYNQAESPRLLVLIDGRQVYADYLGYTPWSTLPVELNEIRQIEVVKGPNSALFGFNAVGGVVNIVTYSPLYDDVNSVGLRGGTQATAEGSAVVTTKLGDQVGLRIGIGGRSDNDFSTPQRATDLNTRRGDNRGEINVLAAFRLNSQVQGSIEVTHSRVQDTEEIVFNQESLIHDSVSSIKGQITADTDFGLVQGSVYSNFFDFVERNDPVLVTFNNQVTVVQLQDFAKLDADNSIRGSLEYRHNTASSNISPGDHVFYDVLSAALTENWQILPTLSLTNAIRLDSLRLGRDGFLPSFSQITNAEFNRTTNAPSFNSGIVWRPDDVDTFRVSAARGVQAPSLVEFGAFEAQVPGLLIGGQPDVVPTIVTNYEVDFDRQIPALDGLLRVSAFHQETDNINAPLATETIKPPIVRELAGTVGDSRADGLELSLRGKFAENWRFGLSYTPEIITDGPLAPGVDRTLAATDFQHTTPVNVVKANLGWASGNWEADLYAQYESSFFGLASVNGVTTGANLVPIQGYLSADGRIAYQVDDWATIALEGQNITQSSQQQTAGPNVERRVFGSVTLKF
jgi:outer membrane receptor for ferrienterochelin and colicins